MLFLTSPYPVKEESNRGGGRRRARAAPAHYPDVLAFTQLCRRACACDVAFLARDVAAALTNAAGPALAARANPGVPLEYTIADTSAQMLDVARSSAACRLPRVTCSVVSAEDFCTRGSTGSARARAQALRASVARAFGVDEATLRDPDPGLCTPSATAASVAAGEGTAVPAERRAQLQAFFDSRACLYPSVAPCRAGRQPAGTIARRASAARA